MPTSTASHIEECAMRCVKDKITEEGKLAGDNRAADSRRRISRQCSGDGRGGAHTG
ncbi:hypothetical protein PR003_g29293 [Phytophthora rubi]|uniref:Tim10-like domain-containing protein n=1 Tax=Phytophthora rubi TaxID=129364 RepID=A0A6A3KG04_9STRA|nr:hypothetical protein PR002_g29695 [Phytophthora rubi]KAE9006310.1 hypothetical protein PR001_g17237 [Phytophthora rubi]KAE9275590.1 hypothetical protein PR003_g29293 [Phytophthora rubi]